MARLTSYSAVSAHAVIPRPEQPVFRARLLPLRRRSGDGFRRGTACRARHTFLTQRAQSSAVVLLCLLVAGGDTELEGRGFNPAATGLLIQGFQPLEPGFARHGPEFP
jgi:hypothetical protein